ncbi:RDD family protein [Nonomuraea endophytica]|uniref:Putative RDD family membrane protein YckC n=1 Tax=Nonomuraea endophytica TaxID=714136 RepID=A0A7W8EG45_9ACTN|nr:RDD family protein [Nonomuraea endophytica]MBB5077157.1 putative RDD family membrane protein YckC [Nonomuraea endophytica]
MVKAPLKPRFVALGLDYLVILGWLAVLAVAALAGLSRLFGASLIADDLLVTGLTVVPVWLYLSVGEASAGQATLGKRRAGLVVTTVDGRRPGPGRVLARNAVKLLPWQLAHMAAIRMFHAPGEMSVAVVAALTVCYGLVLLTLVLLFARRDRASAHDLAAGTRVVSRS